MTTHTRVAIVGGGIMGVSLLYHLTKEGWRDVTLVEKGELTSGSTWHAAALVPHFTASAMIAKMTSYASRLYGSLERETGQTAGWHGCGSLRLALDDDQVDHLRYTASVLRAVNVECHLIGADDIPKLNPLLNLDGQPTHHTTVTLIRMARPRRWHWAHAHAARLSRVAIAL
jgi:dimethylglycine dehydrogenase